jgi:hypothetical protein
MSGSSRGNPVTIVAMMHSKAANKILRETKREMYDLVDPECMKDE